MSRCSAASSAAYLQFRHPRLRWQSSGQMTRDRSNVTALLDEAPSYSRQNQGGIFVVIKRPDRGEAVRLARDPVSFGSGPQCSLVPTDKPVSRKHLGPQVAGD